MTSTPFYFFHKLSFTEALEKRPILGNKGAKLAAMTALGLPVPAGFIIPFHTSQTLCQQDTSSPLWLTLFEYITRLKSLYVASDPLSPFLFSLRSGAAISMPGMMDTLLNLGMDAKVFEKMHVSHPKFACDVFMRFMTSYMEVVLNLSVKDWTHLPSFSLKDDPKKRYAVVLQWRDYFYSVAPQDFEQQIFQALGAVLNSWNSQRAQIYRQHHGISSDTGTAIVIQTMVFGNFSPRSCTGVMFTRHPSTGEKSMFGEYLTCAQGEDVVSGTHTPHPLQGTVHALQHVMPNIFHDLCNVGQKLETAFQDMQDIEFTVQEGRLWILQSRAGKRTATASAKIFHDFVQENLWSLPKLWETIKNNFFEELFTDSLEPESTHRVLGQGLPASPGAAVGKIAFSMETCMAQPEDDWILVRPFTQPDDIHGMTLCRGIITSHGGMTSHAAVVARGMGCPCVTGVSTLHIHETKRYCILDGHTLHEGDVVSISGHTGDIFLGAIPHKKAEITPEANTLLHWLRDKAFLPVYANADHADDIKKALFYEAEGVGLCRSEHMFFKKDRIPTFRHILMGHNVTPSQRKLYQWQKSDYTAMLQALDGRPLTVRLLDPPMHEFFPSLTEALALKEAWNMSEADIHTFYATLQEANPMLGCRGVRLGLKYPHIYITQVQALLSAAQDLQGPKDIHIMVPFISCIAEMVAIKKLIHSAAKPFDTPYKIGAMVEVPSAALGADKLAQECDFLSFGTNDLTQLCLGLSRDDSAPLQQFYHSQNILNHDPFSAILMPEVQDLIRIAVEKARSSNPNIVLGLCGEQASHKETLAFLRTLSLNYVSCVPLRIPKARLNMVRLSSAEFDEQPHVPRYA